MGVLGVRREIGPREISSQVRLRQISKLDIEKVLYRIFNIMQTPSHHIAGLLEASNSMVDYSLIVRGLTISYKESQNGFACEFSAQIKLPDRPDEEWEDRGTYDISDKKEAFILENLLIASAEHVLLQLSSNFGSHVIEVGAYPFPAGLPENAEKACFARHDSLGAFVLAGRISTVQS